MFPLSLISPYEAPSHFPKRKPTTSLNLLHCCSPQSQYSIPKLPFTVGKAVTSFLHPVRSENCWFLKLLQQPFYHASENWYIPVLTDLPFEPLFPPRSSYASLWWVSQDTWSSSPVCCTHVYLIINTIGTIWISKNQGLVASEAFLIIRDICMVLIDVTDDQWWIHDPLPLKLEN